MYITMIIENMFKDVKVTQKKATTYKYLYLF